MEGQKGHSLLSCSAGLGPGWALVWFVLSPRTSTEPPCASLPPQQPCPAQGLSSPAGQPSHAPDAPGQGLSPWGGTALAAVQRLLWLQMCSSKSFWQLEMPQELSREAGLDFSVEWHTIPRAEHSTLSHRFVDLSPHCCSQEPLAPSAPSSSLAASLQPTKY